MIKHIAELSRINGTEYFCLFDNDEYELKLKDFILSFPFVFYKSGVWNGYTKLPSKIAIERCNNSPYGGNIQLEYDEKWEMGELDGRASIYICCPSLSDMY